MSDTVLVTGGAGYIGSHTVAHLNRLGIRAVVYDNLSEGHKEAVGEAKLVEGDLADQELLEKTFRRFEPVAVMHFASRCYVGESVVQPRRYYEEIVGGALTLFRVMLGQGVKRFILSSTCATYGNPVRIPMDEEHPQNPVNPYGEGKYFVERILKSYDRAYGLRFVSLRYFNAAGASLDGRLGESHDPETHLIPRILKAAKGELERIEIFGDDYPTTDGTCIRDYIHVQDLATAHVSALKWLKEKDLSDVFNLGTGSGHSVRSMLETAETITGRKIPVAVAPRRAGDPPELVADSRKAKRSLNWTPRHSDLRTIVETAWRWECGRRF